jgi:hypothetical protein
MDSRSFKAIAHWQQDCCRSQGRMAMVIVRDDRCSRDESIGALDPRRTVRSLWMALQKAPGTTIPVSETTRIRLARSIKGWAE